MSGSPSMQLYALFSTVVAIHLLVLAFWTGTVRVMRKSFVNPEDAKASKGSQVDQDHPDVARVKRAHQTRVSVRQAKPG